MFLNSVWLPSKNCEGTTLEYKPTFTWPLVYMHHLKYENHLVWFVAFVSALFLIISRVRCKSLPIFRRLDSKNFFCAVGLIKKKSLIVYWHTMIQRSMLFRLFTLRVYIILEPLLANGFYGWVVLWHTSSSLFYACNAYYMKKIEK